MTVTTRGTSSNYLQRAPGPSGLADVVSVILDKGIVIDAYVRVSLIGIELLTIDARIVIASVDTYLRFAEAVNRLDLREEDDSRDLPDLIDDMREGGARWKTKGAIEGVKEKGEEATEGAREKGDKVKEKAKNVKNRVKDDDKE
jgi:gas vesicle structural protein